MGEYDQHLLRKHGKFNKERVPKPLFSLGQIVGTQGALQALIETQQTPDELLNRHQTGDWGDLCDEDKQENELSVENGFWIFSAYKLETGVKVWVITEWDRSVTTILLPEEYWYTLLDFIQSNFHNGVDSIQLIPIKAKRCCSKENPNMLS